MVNLCLEKNGTAAQHAENKASREIGRIMHAERKTEIAECQRTDEQKTADGGEYGQKRRCNRRRARDMPAWEGIAVAILLGYERRNTGAVF